MSTLAPKVMVLALLLTAESDSLMGRVVMPVAGSTPGSGWKLVLVVLSVNLYPHRLVVKLPSATSLARVAIVG